MINCSFLPKKPCSEGLLLFLLKFRQNIETFLFYFIGKNDIIGCYLDLDNLEIYYTKNGKDLGRAFSIPKHQGNQTFFPSVVLKNAEMLFNFGDEPWKHPPLEGYVGFAQAPAKNIVANR